MLFTFPWTFLALSAIPALLAIYWLRRRFRRRPVSSLMLWMDQRQAREGGRIFHRLQTPLPFFLELLAIVLLTTAATGPLMRFGERLRPLVVVLDNSYSMLAGGTETTRDRAREALEAELRRDRYDPVRFVLAGETSQVLGDPVSDVNKAIDQLDGWSCLSPSSNLEEAIAFAFELGGDRARILVVTDRPPLEAPERSRLQWWAFGRPQPNAAFVNAARTFHDGKNRCLLEIANLSPQSANTTLTIADLSSQPTIRSSQSLELEPHETRRIFLELKPEAPALRAQLSDDALGIDNEVILWPEERKPVQIEMRVKDATLRSLVEKAVQASRSTVIASTRTDLIITDRERTDMVPGESWVVRIVAESNADAYLGPFVMNRAHPLTEGLSLNGVVWGGGKTEQFPGAPVIMAGSIPLLTDVERAGGRHDIYLRLRPDLSTLQESPNWPILLWNPIAWRTNHTPGVRPTNLRLGTNATLTVESGVDAVRVTDPRG